MSNTNNGGPAFPTLLQAGGMALSEGGLTVRDSFAIAAMQGLLSDPDITGRKEEFAKHAYEMADAMLAERKKGGEGSVEQKDNASWQKDEDIDFSLKAGDVVVDDSWTLTKLIIIGVNWALRAAAVKLGEDGGIVVLPVANLRKAEGGAA